MTKTKISLSDEKNKNIIESSEKNSRRCVVCTGCGRCGLPAKQEKVQVLSSWKRETKQRMSDSECDGKADEISRDALLIAADIGTTTIAMMLRRVCDGEVLDTFRAVNPQRKYGADVLSRIQAANEDVAAEEMRVMVQGILQEGISQFQEKSAGMAADIIGMSVAANTTMMHLLMGYPTVSLGKAPFASEHLEEKETVICGLPTILLPGFSAFVGADVMAGIYACGIDEAKEKVLFLDLGTNGEIVLGNRERMLATATAAGPAFEGRLDTSLWGADAVHFLAQTYREGYVDETGLLAEEYFETGISVGATVMTREDIRSLQLAKAAIKAGIFVLAKEYGMDDIAEIDKVFLAGGLGYYLDAKDAAEIGLIPFELEHKCVTVGNAALEGAFEYGRDYFAGKTAKKADAMKQIKARTKVYNLADSHRFTQEYLDAINLPERGMHAK